MKITCPNCRKEYTINQTKLLQGVKNAKCRACGHPILLKKAPAKASAKPDRIVEIACQYCGQNHRLRQDKIPPSAKTMKCKSCARPVPLSRARISEPAQPLKKNLSKHLPDQPSAKPAASPKEGNDLIHFMCGGCGKKYKIPLNKIPPNVAAVKCKACGHKIQLPHKAAGATAADPIQPPGHQDRASLTKPEPGSEITPPPGSRSRKSKWLWAAAVCGLMAAILGTLVKFDIIEMDRLYQFFPATAEKVADSSPLLDKEPFMALNLNVPLILDAFEGRLESEKKTAQLQMMISMMKMMDLKHLELYLYAAPNSQVLPIILAHGVNPHQWEKALNNQEAFKKYFRRQSSGSYRLQTEASGDAQKYPLPREPYQVIVIDQSAALAPVSFSEAIKKNPQLLRNAPVTRFAQTIRTRQDLASIAVRIPDDINRGWEENIQNHPAVQASLPAAMIAGMGAAIMSQLSDSLKSIDFLALGFRFTDQKGRALSYAQQFRPGVDGEKIYRQLAASDSADTKIDGMVKDLIKLFQDQRYQRTLDFKDNRLALQFSWSQKDDEAFFAALSEASMGHLVAGSMEFSPTPGTVEARYVNEPKIVTTVDTDPLKAKMPQMIKDSLFPGQYWNMGDDPRMMLDVDTIDFPNAALAELTYEVKSIKSPDGREILRLEESNFKPRIQPGSLFPGNISLAVKPGTLPVDLERASIYFHLTVPVALEVFEFTVEDQAGSAKDNTGIRVTLDQLENDVARVSSRGAKAMRLIAYDQTGKALASRESISSPSSTSTRFEGTIHTLKVVVTRKMLAFPFGMDVDLNAGKALVLSREPEIPARMRFNPHPIPNYVNFAAKELENLVVNWNEGREGAWNDSLSIRLPQGPFSGHAIWEVHFFGNHKPLFLTGSPAQGAKDFSFTLDKGQLKQTHAAFGKVQLNLHSDISRLVFSKKSGKQPAAQQLPSGDKISIKFNKNEIAYHAGKADVIQTVAYDARGRRLKQDQYTGNEGGRRLIYFWGVPVKFEIDVSTRIIKKLIPFDIKQRPVDDKAYLAFKQSIENQRVVVDTIKTIDRARRRDRSYYGDDLAGLFYLNDSQQKTPRRLISQEIAHSDPAGQERFGYKVRPYKGYYFTVLSGVEDNGVKKNYTRRSKKSRFSWQKGTIITTSLTRHPDLVAIPADKSQPTFFLQWGQVYMKPLNGEKLEYLPDGYYNKGWVEAKYVDG